MGVLLPCAIGGRASGKKGRLPGDDGHGFPGPNGVREGKQRVQWDRLLVLSDGSLRLPGFCCDPASGVACTLCWKRGRLGEADAF